MAKKCSYFQYNLQCFNIFRGNKLNKHLPVKRIILEKSNEFIQFTMFVLENFNWTRWHTSWNKLCSTVRSHCTWIQLVINCQTLRGEGGGGIQIYWKMFFTVIIGISFINFKLFTFKLLRAITKKWLQWTTENYNLIFQHGQVIIYKKWLFFLLSA